MLGIKFQKSVTEALRTLECAIGMGDVAVGDGRERTKKRGARDPEAGGPPVAPITY